MENTEAYTAPITRNNPALIGILVDMSGSMAQELLFDGQLVTKAHVANMFINIFLEELINRSRREDGYRNYFEFMVIGYSGNGVELLLKRIAPENPFCTVEDLVKSDPELETYPRHDPVSAEVINEITVHKYVDVEPYHSTPMFAGFEEMHGWTKNWITTHPYSFPPIIINLTDGELTDATTEELKEKATRLTKLKTQNGNVLLFNIHIAPSSTEHHVLYPCRKEELPNVRYAHSLFEISSPLPRRFIQEVAKFKNVSPDEIPGAKAVLYNADMMMLLDTITIGTSSITKLQ